MVGVGIDSLPARSNIFSSSDPPAPLLGRKVAFPPISGLDPARSKGHGVHA